MAKLKYPVGDDRNEITSQQITLKICPVECQNYDVKEREVCSGGEEFLSSKTAEVTSFSVYSLNGNFKFLNYLSIEPICPSGVYVISFIRYNMVQITGPVTIIGGLRYIGKDIVVAMNDLPYTPTKIMTIQAAGWAGTFNAGDSIQFTVKKNDEGLYEKQILQLHVCPKFIASKCSNDMKIIQLCMCPIYKADKCSCPYTVDDLHWTLVSGDDEVWGIYWTNPQTCCIRYAELYTLFRGQVFIEYNGSPLIGRALPNSPAIILPDNDPRWDDYTHWSIVDNDGWVCDRLHWSLVEPFGLDVGGYYSINKHGIGLQGVPGEPLKIRGGFDDAGCSDPQDLASLWLETVGLIGGQVKQVISLEDGEYIVAVKDVDVNLKTSDFTQYSVGDWVGIQKVGTKPPRGYPSVSRWMDEDGVWHDPVPDITDQNVPKVDPSGKLVFYESEDVITEFGRNYIGDSGISKFAANDLKNRTIEITQSRASGNSRKIVSVYGSRCYVDSDFTEVPVNDSRFRILWTDVYDPGDNLRIVPYNFRWA